MINDNEITICWECKVWSSHVKFRLYTENVWKCEFILIIVYNQSLSVNIYDNADIVIIVTVVVWRKYSRECVNTLPLNKQWIFKDYVLFCKYFKSCRKVFENNDISFFKMIFTLKGKKKKTAPPPPTFLWLLLNGFPISHIDWLLSPSHSSKTYNLILCRWRIMSFYIICKWMIMYIFSI